MSIKINYQNKSNGKISSNHVLFTDDKFNRFKFLGTIIGFISVFILFYDQVYISRSTTIFSVLIV